MGGWVRGTSVRHAPIDFLSSLVRFQSFPGHSVHYQNLFLPLRPSPSITLSLSFSFHFIPLGSNLFFLVYCALCMFEAQRKKGKTQNKRKRLHFPFSLVIFSFALAIVRSWPGSCLSQTSPFDMKPFSTLFGKVTKKLFGNVHF